MRGLRGRRKAPKEKIVYGQFGIKGIKYIGEMPFEFRGRYTGVLYAFNERRRLLGVDVRDLPGMAEDYGNGCFEARQDDGTFVPVGGAPVKAKAKKPKPAPEETEPQEEIAEVENDE